MVTPPLESLSGWLHNAMCSFPSLLAKDSQRNHLFLQKGFQVTNKNVNFPSGGKLHLQVLITLSNEQVDGLIEYVNVLSEVGCQLHAEATVNNCSEFGQHVVEWQQVFWKCFKDELQFFEESCTVYAVQSSSMIPVHRDALGPHPQL